MKGIILKDLYLNLYSVKNLVTFLSSYIILIPMIYFLKSDFGFITLTIFYFPFAVAPVLLQVSIHKDDVSNYQKIQLTMPVTRKEIILAKYLLGVLFTLVNTVLIFGIMFIYVYGYESIDLMNGLYLVYANIIFSLFSIAIFYVAYIIFGSVKGVFLYLGIMTLIVGLFFSVIKFSVDMNRLIDFFMTTDPIVLLMIGTVIAVGALTISYYCSVKYYERKEIR